MWTVSRSIFVSLKLQQIEVATLLSPQPDILVIVSCCQTPLQFDDGYISYRESRLSQRCFSNLLLSRPNRLSARAGFSLQVEGAGFCKAKGLEDPSVSRVLHILIVSMKGGDNKIDSPFIFLIERLLPCPMVGRAQCIGPSHVSLS